MAKEGIIETTLYRYRFNISNPKEKEQYDILKSVLIETPGRGCWMNAWASLPSSRFSKRPDGPEAGTVELETAFLFNNQWNTECGHRVFDWYEGIYPNPDIKKGHYLTITPEMVLIRENTLTCGYCGNQRPAATGLSFCDKCLGFEYLKEEDLYLLRMVSASKHHAPGYRREPLTSAEEARLIPQYKDAQIFGQGERGRARTLAVYKKVKEEEARVIKHAKEKRRGLIWLLDAKHSIDNVIYYNHTESFGFGWRAPLTWPQVQEVLGFISEFPYPYKITGVDSDGKKRTWEGH